MATNKNQHFVPRCYLRQFTIEAGNKAINLYNIERDSFIENAPVKNQCSGSYFYGQDALLEDIIQMHEQDYANALREIIEPGYELSEEHRAMLLRFWLLQHLRTEAASRRSVELSDGMTNMLELEGTELDFKMEIRDAVQMGMRHFLEIKHVVDDLGICLMRNGSNVPFITSDDPAVLTNRWHLMEPAREAQSFGLSNAGALLILPISPTILCLGYDRDMYSLDSRKGWISINKDSDVEALNQHQHLNCRVNLFVREPVHFESIRAAHLALSKFRPAFRHRINYAALDKEVNGARRFVSVDIKDAKPDQDGLVHAQAVHATPTAWPRQLRWRVGAHYYSNGTGHGFVRQWAIPPDTRRPFEKVRAFR